jgi:hypothetical protein
LGRRPSGQAHRGEVVAEYSWQRAAGSRQRRKALSAMRSAPGEIGSEQLAAGRKNTREVGAQQVQGRKGEEMIGRSGERGTGGTP